MNKILTLTDFSNIANNCIDAAMVFAQKHQSELIIYHLLSEDSYVQYDLNSSPTIYIKNKKDDYANFKIDSWSKKASALNIDTQMIIGTGNIVKEVKKIIENEEIDIVMMGSTGIDESDDIWGTTAQLITRKIDTPVLVIKSEMRDYILDKIVFASNLDLEDQDVLARALKLLNPPNDAEISLMSVDTSTFFSQPSNLIKEALKDFEEVAKPYKSISTFYNDYSVESGIRHFIEESKPDILIMSNRSRNPLKNLLVPNAAIAAVGKIDCPILIIK